MAQETLFWDWWYLLELNLAMENPPSVISGFLQKKYFLERKTVHDLDASLSETLDVFFLQLDREHLVVS